MAAVSERLLQIGKTDMEIVKDNMNRERGNFGYMRDLHNTHHKFLSPGVSLNHIRNEALMEISRFLNDTDGSSSGIVVDLYAWNRHIFTQSSASAVWGRRNPFKIQPELEDAFWCVPVSNFPTLHNFLIPARIVEEEMRLLLLNVVPEYTTPSGSAAREKMYQAFLSYYNNHGSSDHSASDFVKAKTALNQKYKFSNEYMAHSDLGELTAVLFNVVPASFWLLLYIFSSSPVLAEIRTEVQEIFFKVTSADPISEERGVLDVTQIRQKCPLLCSTYKEVLRLIGSVTTNRVVREDTTIKSDDRECLLKKGAVVEIPGAVLHADASIWGPDVNEFNPRRFLESTSPDSRPKPHPAAFRTFGGGATLRPGRHFAFIEILSFVSMVVIGYDITPEDGVWELPKKDTSRLPGVVKPATDVKASVRRREGFERTRWAYSTSGTSY